MKTTTSSKVSVLIMVIIFTMVSFSVNAEHNIKEWYGNQNFTFTEEQKALNVLINKNPWESFTLKIDNFELMNNPVVNLQIKADQDVVLRVDISDGTFISSESEIIGKNISATNSFTDLNFDFTQVLSNIDLSEETYLIFYVNPGKKFNGQLTILNVNFLKETTVENASETNNDNLLNIYPTPATSYTFVEIPEGNFLFLKIYDMSAKEIASIDVSQLSGFEFQFDVSKLNEGCYLIKLIGSEKVHTGKLIVN